MRQPLRPAAPCATVLLNKTKMGDTRMAFYEFRRYEIRPGKMDEWITLFHDEIIPFQTARGMVICGVFKDETGADLFYWMRRFEDEAHREALYKAVYEDEGWTKGIAPRVGECIDRETIQVTRVAPTSSSVLQ